MNCRQFVVASEEFLANHAGTPPVPPQLAAHASVCRRCQNRWRSALRSRQLLLALRENEPEPDPYFFARLQARIRAHSAQRGWHGLRGLNVAWRDLTIAAVLFLATLGSFVYNFNRIEQPNADEAMVLDVPHLNPQHPSDDHIPPQPADVMLNLMNP